jgi:putative permease
VIELVGEWFRRYFSDPQAVILALLLIGGFTVILTLGSTLAPVLASLVIAYLLDGLVGALVRIRVPRTLAVTLVFLSFLGLLLYVFFGLSPLLWQQLTRFFEELPGMIARGQQALMHLPQRYPGFISEERIADLIGLVRAEAGGLGQRVLSQSLSSIANLITLAVYLFLVPFLVFFFLKDGRLILDWFLAFLPAERALSTRVWREMDNQIGRYVRGKIVEVVIVSLATYIAFLWLGLNYAMLLGVLSGASAIIPYIGVVVATLPVALAAYFQWGVGAELAYVLGAYMVIQVLDGNVLAPLLFSEAVNLHPVAIIVAVLFFGGLWGFWGVFFAIPLATLVNALIYFWPRHAASKAA